MLLEKRLIDKHKPMFNKSIGLAMLKVTKSQFIGMKKLRAKGLSYSKIAKHYKLAVMTVHRALTGNTKALQE